MQHQNLGMMFNIDSVMQSPNNSIFQAFSQAVYSSPSSNQNNINNTNVNHLNNQHNLSSSNSNQLEKLDNAIDLDLRYEGYNEDSENNAEQMANDDFFKQYNPLNKLQNKIPRSPKMILKKKK